MARPQVETSGVAPTDGGAGSGAALAAALIRQSAPATAVMLLSGAFLVADAYFVTRLGTDTLAGTVLAFPFLLIVLAVFGGGMGVGISAVVSARIGRGDDEGARAAVATAFVVTLGLSVLLAAAYAVSGEAVLRRMTSSPGTLRAAVDFSWPIFLGAPVIAFSLTAANLLRSARALRTSVVMLLVGAIVNVGLDPLLIFGAAGVPGLGVTGAGLATVAGFVASGAIGARALAVHERLGVRPSGRARRPDRRTATMILRIGLPAILTYTVNNAIIVAITMVWGRYGTSAVAGLGLAIRFEYLLVLLIYGIGSALVVLGGEEVGRGDIDRFRRIVRLSGWLGAGLTGVLASVLAVWPQLWLALFDAEPGVVASGERYLRVVAPAYPAYALALTYGYAYQTVARAHWPLAFVVSRGGLIAVPGVVAAAGRQAPMEAAAGAVAASLLFYGLVSAGFFERAVRRAWREGLRQAGRRGPGVLSGGHRLSRARGGRI